MLIYGIPNFKLEKEIIIRRTDRLINSGINFNLNCEIGATIGFNDIKNKHDAILIATGVYEARKINLNNNNFSNVVPALDFLIASNKKGLKEFINNDFSKFYKPQSIQSNLITDGTVYKNSRTGLAYSGSYHIHPDKGPMIGAEHIKEYHDYLVPIS